MLLVCSLLILLISAVTVVVFLHRSYLKNRMESVCLFFIIIGFNLAILSVCIYNAQFAAPSYLLGRYLFLNDRLLALFRAIPLSLFAISDLLNLGRMFFINGIYCFVILLAQQRLRWKTDWVLVIPNFFLLCNTSFVYRWIILYLRDAGFSLARAIHLFDRFTQIGILLMLPVLIWRLARMRRESDNTTLRRYILLMIVGMLLVWLEFVLVLDLSPSSIANVYEDPIMMRMLNEAIHKSAIRGGFPILYMGVLFFVLFSFALAIWAGLGILSCHNRQQVSHLTINHRIPIDDAQNFVSFLHTHKNQLVSLHQFETVMTPENFAEIYPIIRSITEEMIDTIDDLYENSREIRLNMRLCELLPCVQAAVRTVQRIKPNIPIEIVCRHEVHSIVDPDYIQHAVENLLYNSADACAGNPDGHIVVTVWEKGRFASIAVSDNGVGIRRESLRRVFEPFFSTQRKTHSWGMGLTHVRKVVHAHRGKVHISSTPGEGTTITLQLWSGR